MVEPNNGGERISYTTKELLEAIKNMVTTLATKFDAQTSASREEVSAVRHRVANLELETKLRATLVEEIKALRSEVNELQEAKGLREEVEELKEARAEQRGASALQKVVIGLVGIAVINLIFNLVQQLAIKP